MSKTDKELDELEAETREAAASARRCGHNYICEALTKSADAIAELREKNAGLVERVGTLEGALHEAKLFVYGRSERLYQHLTHVLRAALKENTQ